MAGHQQGTEGVDGSTGEHQDQQLAQLLDMVHGLQRDALLNAIVFTNSDHYYVTVLNNSVLWYLYQ
jgi:hypothetical protein